MAKAQIGAGDVEVELGGEQHVLRPTLEACTKVNELHGSLMQTRTRVATLDFDTIVEVVGLGLGASPQVKAKQLRKLVYDAGLLALQGPVIDFINNIANGGRPIDPAEMEEMEDGDPPIG